MKSNSAKLHRFKGGWIKDWMGFDPMTTPNVLAGIAGVVCMRAPKIRRCTISRLQPISRSQWFDAVG